MQKKRGFGKKTRNKKKYNRRTPKECFVSITLEDNVEKVRGKKNSWASNKLFRYVKHALVSPRFWFPFKQRHFSERKRECVNAEFHWQVKRGIEKSARKYSCPLTRESASGEFTAHGMRLTTFPRIRVSWGLRKSRNPESGNGIWNRTNTWMVQVGKYDWLQYYPSLLCIPRNMDDDTRKNWVTIRF